MGNIKSKNPEWHVIEATANKDYTIIIRFQDGTVKLYDAKPLLDIKIFERLKNPGFFMKARVECGTVVWNDELDIAPEHLYEAGKILSCEKNF